MNIKTNFIGKRVGRLVVIEEDLSKNVVSTNNGYTRKIRYYICQCDCGNIVSVRRDLLGNSKKQTKSCGCLQREIFIGINKKRRLPIGVKPLNQLIHSYKLRSKNGNYEYALTREEFVKLIGEKCYYCGNLPKKQQWGEWKRQNDFLIFNGIDRVNPHGGYTMDNVVTCCSDCNYAKSDFLQSEFFDLIGKIYAIHKDKIYVPSHA